MIRICMNVHNRPRVTFYSLKTLSLDGAVLFWPRANILSKKLPTVKNLAVECFFDKIKALLSFLIKFISADKRTENQLFMAVGM